MAAYRRVYDSCHLQADCQEPGSVPETYAFGTRVWATLTFLDLVDALVPPGREGSIDSILMHSQSTSASTKAWRKASDRTLWRHSIMGHTSKLHNFPVHVSCRRGSVDIWQCNAIRYLLTTSGFVDDVMFSRNRLGTCDANRACAKTDLSAGRFDSVGCEE